MAITKPKYDEENFTPGEVILLELEIRLINSLLSGNVNLLGHEDWVNEIPIAVAIDEEAELRFVEELDKIIANCTDVASEEKLIPVVGIHDDTEKCNAYEADLKLIADWLEKPRHVEVVECLADYDCAIVAAVEENATMEVASAAVQAAREQKNDENAGLFNISVLYVCASSECSNKAARAKVLKLPCSVNEKKKVKMKFMKNLAHNWFKVVHRWKMKKTMAWRFDKENVQRNLAVFVVSNLL